MQYKHIFGPVPSRRLGISLGVDLVTHKICSLNCIYCECGKTTRLTKKRKEYVSLSRVFKELDHYLENNSAPDYITFSGSGEPTLNAGLEAVICYIKEKAPDIRVAVLTNTTLFSDPEVRHALLKADLVVPSLDAASQNAFELINRPIKGVDIREIIEGLETFAKEYSGRVWLEVFILPGINDNEDDLLLLKNAIKRIQPDLVQLNTLDRPGTCEDITPATREQMEKIKQVLDFPDTQIIANVDEQINAKVNRDDLQAAIVETVHRRPCTKKDLLQILGTDSAALDECIRLLIKKRKIIERESSRGVFYETIKESAEKGLK